MHQHFQAAQAELPSLFSIDALQDLLPGVIAPGTIRNALSAGTGPDVLRLGRRVILEREAFLTWLSSRAKAA